MAVIGFAMVGVFMALVMSKAVTPMIAFILVPLAFAISAGYAGEVGGFITESLTNLAPVVALLTFAILYFSIMIDAGLFDPIIRKVLALTGDDPLKILIGTAVLALAVSLDGDGTSTILIVVGAFLPLYQGLGMRAVNLICVTSLATLSTNLTPWGGPTTRVAVALNVDPQQVFLKMIPVMTVMALGTLGVAALLGLFERRRLSRDADTGAVKARVGVGGPGTPAHQDLMIDTGELLGNAATARPRLFWFNALLTFVLLIALITEFTTAPVSFMAAFAVAMLVNFPRPSQQRERLAAHAPTLLSVISMILAAGVLTGVLTGTGMIEAMANSLVAIVPPSLDNHLGPVIAVLAIPAQFFLSVDAYFFGAVPVLAEVASEHGLTPLQTASAALLGGPVHGLSPLVPTVLLCAGLTKVEVGEMLRVNLKWALLVSLLAMVAAFSLGIVPL
jgi:citrate-Mg2+:H+ or citrate-Ca2+:H+ symporter, CitMHS family